MSRKRCTGYTGVEGRLFWNFREDTFGVMLIFKKKNKIQITYAIMTINEHTLPNNCCIRSSFRDYYNFYITPSKAKVRIWIHFLQIFCEQFCLPSDQKSPRNLQRALLVVRGIRGFIVPPKWTRHSPSSPETRDGARIPGQLLQSWPSLKAALGERLVQWSPSWRLRAPWRPARDVYCAHKEVWKIL